MHRSMPRSMHTRLATAPLAFALVCTTALAQEGQGEPAPAAKDEPTVLAVGDTVPKDVQLTDTDGKPFSFEQARGKVVAIHFWSTTCPWEKAAEPKLMKLASDFAERDVVVVAINANRGEIGEPPAPDAFAAEDEDARPYPELRKKAGQVKFNHRILIDHGGEVARLLAAKSTPHCFVIDKKGVLVYSGALDDNGRGEVKQQYVRDAVEAALAGREVETSTTRPYG